MEIRERIENYVETHLISEKSLSEKTGIESRKLNYLLHSAKKVDSVNYMKICDALGLPLDYFVKGVDDECT